MLLGQKKEQNEGMQMSSQTIEYKSLQDTRGISEWLINSSIFRIKLLHLHMVSQNQEHTISFSYCVLGELDELCFVRDSGCPVCKSSSLISGTPRDQEMQAEKFPLPKLERIFREDLWREVFRGQDLCRADFPKE